MTVELTNIPGIGRIKYIGLPDGDYYSIPSIVCLTGIPRRTVYDRIANAIAKGALTRIQRRNGETFVEVTEGVRCAMVRLQRGPQKGYKRNRIG